MRYSEIILEGRENPSKFWLVFDIPTGSYGEPEKNYDILMQVAAGEMKGIQGISDNKDIMTDFFAVARNAALVMKPDEVFALNDLSMIDYSDHESMVANNMAALKRLWLKTDDRPYTLQGFMQQLVEYVMSAMKKINYSVHHTMEYYGFPTFIGYLYKDMDRPNVNSMDDLSKLIFNLSLEYLRSRQLEHLKDDLKIEDFRAALSKALAHVERVYKSEGEWKVNSPTFKVPKGSILLLLKNQKSWDGYEEWVASAKEREASPFHGYNRDHGAEDLHALFQIIDEHDLDQRYDIRFVDRQKFEAARGTKFGRRAK